MKKILFSANNLEIGGIEKALVTLLNKLINNYEITLVLERKQGIFLEELDNKINIIEYIPSDNKNIIIRKILNLVKRLKFIVKYKNKFDFSASFATYSKPGSFVSLTASKNSCLWCHADYLTLYDNNVEEMKKFFEEINYKKFKKIIFVSKEGRDSFLKVLGDNIEKNNIIFCNNLINYEQILKKSNSMITKRDFKKIHTVYRLKSISRGHVYKSAKSSKFFYKKNDKITTFLNVGRHDERQKRLTRIIEACKKLKEENYKFKVLFIGEGEDTKLYKSKVEEYNLKNEMLFLGKKQNPYPYFNISDCVILSSDYEGYPVVFLESFVLNKPIITTKVSDYEEVKNGRGIVTEKTVQSIYQAMKREIENKYVIENEFNPREYNDKILEKIEKIINS